MFKFIKFNNEKSVHKKKTLGVTNESIQTFKHLKLIIVYTQHLEFE